MEWDVYSYVYSKAALKQANYNGIDDTTEPPISESSTFALWWN